MRIKINYLGFFIFCVLLSFCISACRKVDQFHTPFDISSTRERFFSKKAVQDDRLKKVIQSLEAREEINPFVEKLVKRAGFPLWNKTLMADKDKSLNRYLSRSSGEDTSFYYTPFTADGIEGVQAIMITRVEGVDTMYKFITADEYKEYPVYSNQGATATDVAVLFFAFENMVYGKNELELKDTTRIMSRSLPSGGNYTDIRMSMIGNTVEVCREEWSDVDNDHTNGNETLISRNCSSWEIGNVSGSGGSSGGNSGGNGNGSSGSGNNNNNSGSGSNNSGSGSNNSGSGSNNNSGSGNNNNGGSGNNINPPSWWGGSGGGGVGGGGSITDLYTINDPNPFGFTPGEGNNFGPGGPVNNFEGWQPIIVNPYSILTKDEKDALDAIAMDDKEADDHVSNPSPCRGTYRMGNYNFQGTLEHWMVQIDYMSRNPMFSEREYAIPGAGTNGGFGYADLANTWTKEMYEIKPRTQIGAGQTEIANYVAKANISCMIPASGGSPAPWQIGSATSYGPPRTLPWPGVISYELLQTSTPIPPLVVPQTVLDKITNLLKKLKDKADNIEYEMGVFLKNNPDVKSYLQGAAVGAAVVIVLGTIIEDILTAGAGIADDWACFMLAYKLVRVAAI